MNLMKALHWRYAVREFSSDSIAPKQLQQLVEFSFGQDKVANCSHLIIFTAHTNVGDEMVDRYIQQFSAVREVAPTQLHNMAEHYKIK
jgi:nitroreductase/dihydropteridine reductase